MCSASARSRYFSRCRCGVGIPTNMAVSVLVYAFDLACFAMDVSAYASSFGVLVSRLVLFVSIVFPSCACGSC